jgi:hypothetical protein
MFGDIRPVKKLLASVSLLPITFLCSCTVLSPQQAPHSIAATTWSIDNTISIAGRKTTVLGAPTVIATGKGNAMQYDGQKDGLIVEALPLAGAQKFTLEIIFRPDAKGRREQRFLHLQQNTTENRILIETRLTDDNLWYLDTYIQTPKGQLALFNPQNTHPVEKWYNAALVYDGQQMRHYVNGVEEMSGALAFRPLGRGRTSIGVRMNRVFWFKGAIRKVRFTPSVLKPQHFLPP